MEVFGQQSGAGTGTQFCICIKCPQKLPSNGWSIKKELKDITFVATVHHNESTNIFNATLSGFASAKLSTQKCLKIQIDRFHIGSSFSDPNPFQQEQFDGDITNERGFSICLNYQMNTKWIVTVDTFPDEWMPVDFGLQKKMEDSGKTHSKLMDEDDITMDDNCSQINLFEPIHKRPLHDWLSANRSSVASEAGEIIVGSPADSDSSFEIISICSSKSNSSKAVSHRSSRANDTLGNPMVSTGMERLSDRLSKMWMTDAQKKNGDICDILNHMSAIISSPGDQWVSKPKGPRRSSILYSPPNTAWLLR